VNKNHSKDCLGFGGKNELGVDVANSYFSLSFSLATQGRSQLKNKLDFVLRFILFCFQIWLRKNNANYVYKRPIVVRIQ
jgi:hypothetical protein